MSLNSSSYFSREPGIHVARSRFDRSHTHKTTFNNGEIIPIYCSEILPGDTVSMDLSSVVRMSTPIKPVMDNVMMDVAFFFVPNRLVWKHWEEFMGANKSGHWTPQVTYTVPQIKMYHHVGYNAMWSTGLVPGSYGYGYLVDNDEMEKYQKRGVLGYIDSNGQPQYPATTAVYSDYTTWCLMGSGFDSGSLADYFGIPIGTDVEFSQLPIRAYGLIWNDYYRAEPYMDPVDIKFDSDLDVDGMARSVSTTYDRVNDTIRARQPLRVSRFHDYFSSVLPQPQFGDDVIIPHNFEFAGYSAKADRFKTPDKTPFVAYYNPLSSDVLFGSTVGANPFFLAGQQTRNNGTEPVVVGYTPNATIPQNVSVGSAVLPVDLQGYLGTINDLREAFQVQKYLERSARSGSRYIEIIKAQFGVDNPDLRLQRPEFLGSYRDFLNITQVLQTSSTDLTTPQGNTAAYSLTSGKRSLFTKSFTEHGYLIGLCYTRTSRSYQQGLNRSFSRKNKFDYYFPVFSNIGEQPVRNKEIFLWSDAFETNYYSLTYTYPEEIFGYQEAWAEYRYDPDRVSGDFRSMSGQSLDFWHFADYYTEDVFASEDWLLEGPQNLDRCLAVSSDLSHQFIADFYFKAIYTRAMPLYSIPGLADHF